MSYYQIMRTQNRLARNGPKDEVYISRMEDIIKKAREYGIDMSIYEKYYNICWEAILDNNLSGYANLSGYQVLWQMDQYMWDKFFSNEGQFPVRCPRSGSHNDGGPEWSSQGTGVMKPTEDDIKKLDLDG